MSEVSKHQDGSTQTPHSASTPIREYDPPRLNYSQLDPGVRPLVRAMNDTCLVRTFGSCQGHPGEEASQEEAHDGPHRDESGASRSMGATGRHGGEGGEAPYIDFYSSVEVAGAFARLLLVLNPDSGSNRALSQGWELTGRFAPGRSGTLLLAWCISPCIGAGWPGIEAIDRDIKMLTDVLPPIALRVRQDGQAPSLSALAREYGANDLLASDVFGAPDDTQHAPVECPGRSSSK